MNVISINGSARGAKGITSRLLKSFEKGLIDAGSNVVSFNLNEMSIEHCRSCFSCMHKNPGVCAIKDGMEDIYRNFKISDLFLVGTPLYTDNMTSRMKMVFDRCMCSMQPFLYRDGSGHFRHPLAWRMPKHFILVSTSGFPEQENFKCLVETVKAQAHNVGAELYASILIPGSIAIQTDVTLLDTRLEVIRLAGVEYGKNGNISKDLLERINTPLFSSDEYYKYYLKYEEWCKKKHAGVK